MLFLVNCKFILGVLLCFAISINSSAQIPAGGGELLTNESGTFIKNYAGCRSSTWLCNTEFDSVYIIYNYGETFLVKKDGKFGIWSTSQAIDIYPKFDSIKYKGLGGVFVRSPNSSWELVTNLGKNKKDLECDTIIKYGEGYGAIVEDRIKSIIAVNGDVKDVDCQNIKILNGHLLLCYNQNKNVYYLHNSKGIEVLDYENIKPLKYNRNEVLITRSGKCGVLNTDNNEILFKYEL